MLLSMTGFGSAEGQIEGVEYSIETRSVNNRYLKTSIRLPDIWSHAEGTIEKLVRSHVSRGTVSLTVRMRLPDEKAAHQINIGALNSYLEQLRPLEIEANPTFRIDLANLLELPGVCEPPEPGDLIEKSREALFALIEQAMTRLVESRRREGKALAADLRTYCDTIEKYREKVVAVAPKVVQAYRDRLTQRVTELMENGRAQLDEDILAREVAMFAERCDVAEELQRLGEHVKQFRKALEASEPGGRRLDFIAQEMLREANTIASKANDANIVRSVVEMKTAIDRIKEQVQNVE